MKKITLTLVALSIVILSLSAFLTRAPGSLKGRVSPAEAGSRAIAVSATDTFSSTINEGAFMLGNVKPGRYNLMIEAKAPYSNSTLADISVKDGEVTDVGEIQLIKQ